MDKKEEGKKGINLMPEDLRSKESGILSKVKSKAEFDFDFVSPKDSSLKKAEKNTGSSFFNKIKKIFNKPKSFGQASSAKIKESDKGGERPKVIYNPRDQKKEVKPDVSAMHVPDKQKHKKDNLKVDYKDSVLKDTKKEASIDLKVAASVFDAKTKQEDKIEYKTKKPSFWDKLKRFFAAKTKVPKAPKEIKIPAKPTIVKDIKEPIGKKIEATKTKEDKPISIVPEAPVKDIEETKFNTILPDKKPVIEKVEPVIEEKKDTAFSIPSAPSKKIPKKKEHVESFKLSKAKEEELEPKKFHKPQTRVRAKFLEDGGGVDLIPDSAKTRSWRQIINLLVVSSLGSIFVIAIFYGFLFYQAKNIESQKINKAEQITSLEKQIKEYKDLNNDITFLGDEIKTIHKLLGFHFYWTNFFQLLEKYTLAEVRYLGIAVGNGGALTLKAVGNDFETIARQIKVLEQEEAQEFVTAVSVSSASYSEINDNVEFDITMILNSSLFTYNENYIYETEASGGE